MATQGFGQSEFPADHIAVSAVNDGHGVLRLSQHGATWEHKSQSWPTDVRINGSPWNPRQAPTFAPAPAGSLLQDGLDFSQGVIHILRGKGRVWCSIETNDLVIEFDNHDPGTELYEVTVDFAPALARKQNPSTKPGDLQLHIAARIDGTDECWLSADGLSWTHTGGQKPKNVAVNGKPWDVDQPGTFSPGLNALPEMFDFQRATMQKERGRDTMNLDYRPERSVMAFEYYDPSVGDEFATAYQQLCLDFESRKNNADDYEARVTVPAFGQRYLVRVEAHGVNDIFGTPLRIFREPAGSETRAVLAGQRFFGTNGDCLVALEAGRFQFEALRQDTAGHLIALRSDWGQIAGPTNINLHPINVRPAVILPSEGAGSPVETDDISLRSVRPAGAVQWSRNGASKSEPYLTLSEDQTYRAHAFGHAGTNYFAVWTAFRAGDKATLQADKWWDRSFKWSDDTPDSISRDVMLNFPDGNLEIPRADRCRLLTNRRFFTIGYRLNFAGGRHAVFEPRGAVLDIGTGGEVLLGGALHPVASAAIFQDEGLGNPRDLNLWHETTLIDPQGYILDTTASSIRWSEKITWKDGTALPKPPLPNEAAARIGNNPGELVESASCILDKRVEWTNSPTGLSAAKLNWYSTATPAYRSWNTATYLAKENREFSFLNQLGGIKDDAKKQLKIKWWFNHGAIGGGDSVTMPIQGYMECTNWYSHTWSMAHETLHNFGFGHTHEMYRLDDAVQEQMDFFRWWAADTPNYAPAPTIGW